MKKTACDVISTYNVYNNSKLTNFHPTFLIDTTPAKKVQCNYRV